MGNFKVYENRSRPRPPPRVPNFNSYLNIGADQIPIIYSEHYNISFFGFESLHNFDSKKYGKIFEYLKAYDIITDSRKHVVPNEANTDTLLKVHPLSYLQNLRWSSEVSKVLEVPLVAALPNFLIQSKILTPFRYQTGGSILGAKLAAERGWAINLGGGFHHCSAKGGAGFCVYADITLTIKYAQERLAGITNVMIVDLDAHQGNGHERDFYDDRTVYIMDIFNRNIYPGDDYAKDAIRKMDGIRSWTANDEYLEKVDNHLLEALNEFQADLIVYNAGTDILESDPLGSLSISPGGVVKRDEIVFTRAKENNIPILMLTSGGYRRQTSSVIANSIVNLFSKRLIE